MRPSRPVLEIDWVVPVEVRALGDAVRIARPEGECFVVRGETKRVRVLAEPVDVGVVGKRGFYAEILRLEDEGVGGGGEEDFICVGAVDGEREGGLGVVELNGGCLRGCMGRHGGAREDVMRDFVAILSRVGDFDVDAGVCRVGFKIYCCLEQKDIALPVSYTTRSARVLMSFP